MRRFFAGLILFLAALTFASTLIYGILDEPKALNVWVDYGPHAITWSKYVFSHKYRSLYRFAHVTLDFVPDLAAKLPKISHEGTYVVYDIELRKGLRWSDGTPITAQDVAFTLNSAVELIKNHGLGGNWHVMVNPDFFEKAVVVNDLEVKLYFKKVGALSVEFGTLMAPIIQKAYWEPHVDKVLNGGEKIDYLYSVDTIENPDPSSGPFILVRWEKGAFIELKAVENYFDKGYTEEHYENGAIVLRHTKGYLWKSKPEEGKMTLKVVMGPFVDGIIYRVYADKASAVHALVTGEIDMILSPHGLQEGDLEEIRRAGDIKVIYSPGANLRYLGFNLRRYPMNLSSMRKAILYITDMDYLASRILKGTVVLTDSIVPPTNVFWSNPNVRLLDHSLSHVQRLKMACEILKKAGFRWKTEPKFSGDKLIRGGKGLVGPDGKPIEEIVLIAPTESYDPVRASIALYIEKWANEIGVPVKAMYMDFKAIIGKVWYERDFDMYILGWGASITPDHLIRYFMSSSEFNPTGYSNPKYDDICEKLLRSDLLNARAYAYDLQEILAEDLPIIPLYTPMISEAFRKVVKFPYLHTFSGLQSVYGLPAFVKKEE